jgi:hypothetical protein
MANCLSCRRPVAVARATCLYCGAALPPEHLTAALAAAAREDAPPAARGAAADRSLVVLDLADANPDTLARALGMPRYEAGLLAKRGGLHLHRVLDPAEAAVEAQRLGARGVTAVLVPEAEARVRPLRATGGARGEGALIFRTEEGPVTLRRGDVLLVVQGPITREYQTSFKRKRVDTARLEEGYRVHLHRASEPRPVEVDAANFEFGPTVTRSTRLELDGWLGDVAGGAPRDDGFRRLPPALGPAEPEPKGALSAAGSLGLASRRRQDASDEGSLVLDNVEQFRFYSGWRAAVERRR